MLGGLQHFKFRGNDVIVFHVMDKAEMEFSFDRITEFIDPETGERLLGATLPVDRTALKLASHRVSDAIYERILGVRGWRERRHRSRGRRWRRGWRQSAGGSTCW